MITTIQTLSDSRVAPFVDVTHADKRESATHFIAEGENVTLRLLASDYACEKVLCIDRKADRIAPFLQAGTELLTAPIELIQQIVGFKFHSGVMGLGVRKPLETSVFSKSDMPRKSMILVLPEITDPANLGAIFRVAAAFGVDAVVLGEQCRDPFTRQTVRTSMGTIFALRLIQTSNIRAEMQAMQSQGICLFATVLDRDAKPLHTITAPARCALLLGNEGPGLEADIANLCDHKITIPMQLNTDSLNVVVACGIFLHHFTQQRFNA